jgi:hypothetical protein
MTRKMIASAPSMHFSVEFAICWSALRCKRRLFWTVKRTRSSAMLMAMANAT